MNGAAHYKAAERLLSRSLYLKSDGRLVPKDPEEADFCLRAAAVHQGLALAAATAMAVTMPMVGDSHEVTEWAHLIQSESFGKRSDAQYAEVGEDMIGVPRPGDVWRDRENVKWLYEYSGLLVNMSDPAKAGASGTWDEIREHRGFLTLVYRTRLPIDEAVCPF